MRFGFCTSPENFKFIKECGYDYAEMSLASLQGMSDGEFHNVCKICEDADIYVEAFNGMFGAVCLLGDNADRDNMIRDYLSKAFSRAAKLGGKVAVFGSGGARRRPDNLLPDIVLNRLCAVIRIIGEEAAKYGIKVAVEELNKNETNVINTLADAAPIIKAVGLSNVGCVADTYHILVEEGDFDSIVKYADIINHAHIACGLDRKPPSETFAEELKKIAAAFKTAGYSDRISVEAGSDDFKNDAVHSLAVLKKYFSEV